MYTLDLDLYLKGYSIEEFNCLNIPMAASCGCYNYENYFYYGFLTAVQYNWSNKSYKDNYFKTESVIDDIGLVLEELGMHLEKHYPKTQEEFVNLIVSSLKEDKPVMMCVKYNALFYHKYFENANGDDLHFMVISQYNEKTHVIRIHDSSFLRGVNVMANDSDILFPLSLKEEMVWEIWNQTNKDADDRRKKIYDGIYVLELNEDAKHLNETKLLSYAIQCMEKNGDLFKEFIISTGDKEYGIDIQRNFEYFEKKFVGCINGMFRSIRYWLDKRNLSIPDDVLVEYSKRRKEVFMKVYKMNLRKRFMEQEKIELLLQSIEEQNNKLISYLKMLAGELTEEEEINIPIKIDQYFSNQAFGKIIDSQCTADISGTGIYFIMSESLLKSKAVQSKMQYRFPCVHIGSGKDNISCNGETVLIPEGRYKKIKILACSEYGSYKEVLKYGYMDQELMEEDFWVSDFYLSPIYCEHTYCTGDSYQNTDGNLEKLEFKSRIFEYQIFVKDELIDRIVLPDRKNIHIFAITLVK